MYFTCTHKGSVRSPERVPEGFFMGPRKGITMAKGSCKGRIRQLQEF